uniref:Uncharacterized protein n=1 Tax=Caenorhabditis japonica TaxID=281687 RepID=A0A8R1IQA5_CAEJA
MTDVYRTTISTARDRRDAFPGSVGISRRQEPLGETEGRGNTPRGSSQSRLPVASAPTFLIRPPRRRLYTTSFPKRSIAIQFTLRYIRSWQFRFLAAINRDFLVTTNHVAATDTRSADRATFLE